MNAAIALAARESADTPGNSRAGGGSDGVPKKAIRDGRRVGHVAGRAGGCILSAAAAQPIGAPAALEGRLQGSTCPWLTPFALTSAPQQPRGLALHPRFPRCAVNILRKRAHPSSAPGGYKRKNRSKKFLRTQTAEVGLVAIGSKLRSLRDRQPGLGRINRDRVFDG